MEYIADKDLYKAVMFARKMVSENGYFNKACRIAADYYNVDEDDVAKYVRQAQSDGQKRSNKLGTNKGKKLKWFIVQEQSCCDATGVYEPCSAPKVVKGFGADSVERRYADIDFNKTMRYDYGGNYAPDFSHFVIGDRNGYSSENEAIEAMKYINNGEV